MIPNGDEFVEQPLPEQFRTQVSLLKSLGKLHLKYFNPFNPICPSLFGKSQVFNALVRVFAQIYANTNTWHGGAYMPPPPGGKQG